MKVLARENSLTDFIGAFSSNLRPLKLFDVTYYIVNLLPTTEHFDDSELKAFWNSGESFYHQRDKHFKLKFERKHKIFEIDKRI